MSTQKTKALFGKLKYILMGAGVDKKNEQPQGEALVRRFPQLTNEQRAERVAVIKAANRELSTLSASVRREFASIDNWKHCLGQRLQLCQSSSQPFSA
jgi:biotin-(acetyl-CoA carboxylase) ligase